MLLELHAHTNRHSKCSQLDPVKLVKKTAGKGLQGLVITEHHYLWSDEELDQLRIDAGIEKWFVLLSGQEVETDIGHVLVFGAGRTIGEKNTLKDLRKLFPEAALVWAHPFRKGASPSKDLLSSPLLNGIEIFSLNHSTKENYAGLKSWHALKFTALSGSDAHSEENAGVIPSQFDHSVKTIDEVATEIRNGRVRPFFKEIPKSGSDLTVTEITLGTKGEDEQRQRIIVKTIIDEKKWIKTKESAEFLKKIYDNGFNDLVYRVPRIIDINDKETTLIEEGQRGKNLFDSLLAVSPTVGRTYFVLAAKWLSRFHALNLQPLPASNVQSREKRKFTAYANSFKNTENSKLDEALKLLEFAEKYENDIFSTVTASFVWNHGDYHPKNIIIGHDRTNDPGTLFVSVIDFANSISFLPTFDIGCFLAQFASQFHNYPDVLMNFDEGTFLEAYFGDLKQAPAGFMEQINFFKIRANLSIASYLIRIGKGESSGFHDLISRSTSLMQELK